MLSVDAVQVRSISAPETAVADSAEGAVGAVVSGLKVIATAADADFVLSACETAVTITLAGLGTLEGAV
jgi:hypothetical protein